MNLFREIFGNRRKRVCATPDDRRAGPVSRIKEAAEKKDAAADELCRTVSMSRADFKRMMDSEK